MRKLRKTDTMLLAILLPFWLACAVLHVKQVASGRLAWLGVYVSAAPRADGLPTVRDFWPGADTQASGGLAVGDRLQSVGGADLQGVGPFGFVARAYAAASDRRDLRIPLVYERDGTIGETTIRLIPVSYPWRMLPLTCSLVLTAALVLTRRPGKRVARAFFLCALAYGSHWIFFFGGPRVQTYAWAVVFLVSSTVMLPLILRATLVFPTQVAPASGMPWWPWLFAIFGPISASWTFGVPLPPKLGFQAVFLVNALFIITLLAVLTRNFLSAGPLGRRQLKWIMLGMYAGTVPVLVADVAAAFVPSLWWMHEVATVAEIAIPIGVLIAIVRANYFDVDRLITGAAVYSLLTIVLVASVLAGVPHIARAASEATDLDSGTVQLALSFLFAVALLPAQRLLRPYVERLLFHDRYALRAGVEDLLRDLASADGPEELLTLAGKRLVELVRPRACVIYAPLGDRFAAVFARGAEDLDAPPVFSAGAETIDALGGRTAPLDVDRWRAARKGPLEHDEQVALDSLGAALFLPVRQGNDLAAAICLGHKRSGDVYTANDLALLAAVADKLSGELLRFDHQVVLRQEREMGEALRRYVPQAVAARLTRGQAIEGGERDVSVLFVDIRGYTSYSEQRAAGALFSVINVYTEAVSAVIQDCGGTVVEFLGDGLMAVFGAPDPCPEHAEVAVRAAREVIAAVRNLTLDVDEDTPIAVGVGIASGRAFVGNIQTSERLVYTAVGDVVNLASRIQGLTRELDAAVAIDSRTHSSAGKSAARFKRHAQMPIRGRTERVDVYSLPLSAA